MNTRNEITRLLLVLLLVSGIFVSCTKKKEPVDVIGRLQECMANNDNRCMKDLFTDESRQAIDEWERIRRDDKGWQSDFNRKFPVGSEWEMKGSRIQGNSGVIDYRCIKHPVENVRGMLATMRIRYQDGSWKIDIAEEIQRSLKDYRRFSKERPSSK